MKYIVSRTHKSSNYSQLRLFSYSKDNIQLINMQGEQNVRSVFPYVENHLSMFDQDAMLIDFIETNTHKE